MTPGSPATRVIVPSPDEMPQTGLDGEDAAERAAAGGDLHIDLDAIAQNYRAIRQLVRPAGPALCDDRQPGLTERRPPGIEASAANASVQTC